MATKPRGFFTLEQRDNMLTEMYDRQQEIQTEQRLLLQKVDTFIETQGWANIELKKCFKDDQIDLGEFKRDVVKGAVAVVGALATLIIAVIAMLI